MELRVAISKLEDGDTNLVVEKSVIEMNGVRGQMAPTPQPLSAARNRGIQDGDRYGQNTGALGNSHQSSSRMSNAQPQRQSPNGKIVLEGYREDIAEGFEGEVCT